MVEQENIRQIIFSGVNGESVSILSSHEDEDLQMLRQLVKDILTDYKEIKNK